MSDRTHSCEEALAAKETRRRDSPRRRSVEPTLLPIESKDNLVEGSLFPHNVGTEQKRFFKFAGDKLILKRRVQLAAHKSPRGSPGRGSNKSMAEHSEGCGAVERELGDMRVRVPGEDEFGAKGQHGQQASGGYLIKKEGEQFQDRKIGPLKILPGPVCDLLFGFLDQPGDQGFLRLLLLRTQGQRSRPSLACCAAGRNSSVRPVRYWRVPQDRSSAERSAHSVLNPGRSGEQQRGGIERVTVCTKSAALL